MSWLSRFLNTFRREHLRRDLDDELDFHLSAKAEELARTPAVAGLILSDVGFIVALGLSAGLAGGMGASRLIAALLHEVTPLQLGSIAAPLACLLFACVLAALLPALRATSVQPITVLRHE